MRVEVVLQRDGDAVQRAAGPVRAPLFVQLVGDLQSLGVGLDHGSELRALAVQGSDPVQVELCDRARRAFARLHRGLQVGDGGLVELESTRLSAAGPTGPRIRPALRRIGRTRGCAERGCGGAACN